MLFMFIIPLYFLVLSKRVGLIVSGLDLFEETSINIMRLRGNVVAVLKEALRFFYFCSYFSMHGHVTGSVKLSALPFRDTEPPFAV